MKKNKKLLIILGIIGVIIILPLMIFFILYYYITYYSSFSYGNQSLLSFPKWELLNECNNLCNLLNKINQSQIKNYCCYSKDSDYDNIIENNGDWGSEICSLAYECEINCSDYGFDSVEGCD